MRKFFIVATILAWLLLGWKMLRDIGTCCPGCAGHESAAAVVPVQEAKKAIADCPYGFAWESDNLVLCKGWENWRDSLKNAVGEKDGIEIMGYFSDREANNSKFENLGLARANAVKDLFSSYFPDERFRLRSRKINDKDSLDTLRRSLIKLFMNTKSLVEIDDRTLIYFPSNSTNKLKDNEVEAYLDKVIERLKDTKERVELVGYTDNQGSESSNVALGLRRAKVIKQYLTTHGLAGDRISIASKGESSPVATNDTEAGRAKNRRTELTIIK